MKKDLTFYHPYSTSATYSGLDPEWVSGFTDAECTFALKIIKRSGYTLGWGVEPNFIVGLHAKDLPLLEKIQSFFGVGKISIGNNNAVFYYVSSVQELTNVIIPHFENYPLFTQKKADFILFKLALDIINNKQPKKPLTLEYLNKLIAIKGSLNWGLSDVLKKAFPDIAPVLRPEVELPEFISPQWLAGFIDGEGCFYILTSNSKLYKTGTSVQLQFSITQHSRDKNLMIRLKDFLNCGFIKEGKKQPVVSFNVTKLSDIKNIIIPFLDKNSLQGIKYKDFDDFKKVVEIMETKSHLTLEGLNTIQEIKKGMNDNRKI
jgi:hypothetical protein